MRDVSVHVDSFVCEFSYLSNRCMLVAVVHINYQLVNLVEQTPEELFIMAGTAND